MVCYLKIGHYDIPVKIIQEWRMSTRVALGKDHVILRIPKTLFNEQIQQHLNWATGWLHKIEAQKPNTLSRYIHLKTYENGSMLEIGGQTFTLFLSHAKSEMAGIKLRHHQDLVITLPVGKEYDEQKVIKKLLARFACRYFQPRIAERVTFYNNQYFRQPYNTVRLKYNKSNWGSCSGGRNLNFSVRLFFAPPEVIDYVVVHELAHLIEMNHSPRFWKLVSDVIPDYKKSEKLLKANSYLYDF